MKNKIADRYIQRQYLNIILSLVIFIFCFYLFSGYFIENIFVFISQFFSLMIIIYLFTLYSSIGKAIEESIADCYFIKIRDEIAWIIVLSIFFVLQQLFNPEYSSTSTSVAILFILISYSLVIFSKSLNVIVITNDAVFTSKGIIKSYNINSYDILDENVLKIQYKFIFIKNLEMKIILPKNSVNIILQSLNSVLENEK